MEYGKELVDVLTDIKDELKETRKELALVADKLEKIYQGLP